MTMRIALLKTFLILLYFSGKVKSYCQAPQEVNYQSIPKTENKNTTFNNPVLEKSGNTGNEKTNNRQVITDYVFPNNELYDFVEALDFCSTFSYNGYSNWRIPSLEEMKELIATKGKIIFDTQKNLDTYKLYWINKENSTYPTDYHCLYSGPKINGKEYAGYYFTSKNSSSKFNIILVR